MEPRVCRLELLPCNKYGWRPVYGVSFRGHADGITRTRLRGGGTSKSVDRDRDSFNSVMTSRLHNNKRGKRLEKGIPQPEAARYATPLEKREISRPQNVDQGCLLGSARNRPPTPVQTLEGLCLQYSDTKESGDALSGRWCVAGVGFDFVSPRHQGRFIWSRAVVRCS